MEERYSKTVREGDAYASIREVVDGQLTLNVGRWAEDRDGSWTQADQELTIREATMDLLVRLYAEWKEARRPSQGAAGAPQEA